MLVSQVIVVMKDLCMTAKCASDDDLTVELDVETARRLHTCWQATQQRRASLSPSTQLNTGTRQRQINNQLSAVFFILTLYCVQIYSSLLLVRCLAITHGFHWFN